MSVSTEPKTSAPAPAMAHAVLQRTDSPVLLVDDDPDVVDVLRELLELNGYTVQTASTVEEAKARADALNPVGVLLDLGLPDPAAGLQLVHDLRQRFGTDIVVVVLTGYPDRYHAASEAGADYFLTKPVDFQKFGQIFRPLD